MSIQQKSSLLRRKAFEDFKAIAEKETANGAETLSLFRLIPQFSTAPTEETESYSVLCRYWSRNGHGQWLIEAGEELYNWASANGYTRGPTGMQ